MSLTLIIGGARSGKSDLAQRLASAARDVVFVATMEPQDDELRARVASHRASRPAAWRTIEEPRDVIGALVGTAPETCVLLDCMTLWVSNMLLAAAGVADEIAPELASAAIEDVRSQAERLAEWATVRSGDTIVVTNEVGLGVVPAYALGRVYRDALGAANRIIAARADRVLAVNAGLVLDLKAAGAVPIERFAPERT